MNFDIFMQKSRHNLERATISVKWVIFSILVGLVVGLVGTAFYLSLSFVTIIFTQNRWMLYFLPVAGVTIVALYHVLHDEKDTGTNLVISSIHSDDQIPFRMFPLIFVSTLLTHMCGGSAGREGAALQIGGSIGSSMGTLFRFNNKDKHIMIMCGMSAAFSAVFGTPMAAAIFSIELITVGIMHYSALVPCVLSSLVAHGVAVWFGLSSESFTITSMPTFRIKSALIVSVLAILCALVSVLFCIIMHTTEHAYKKYITNPYIRAFVGGCIIIVLTMVVGDYTFNGSGMGIIEGCFEGEVLPYAFLVKIIFTALCIGAGFKGGEIVPAFTTGAAFGCLFGVLTGFSPSLCSAVGMIAVFCGVTNCPISSLLIAFEMFGYEGMPYFLLTVAFSYMFSGYYGLYHSQRIVYSKYKTNYINKNTI